MSVQPWICISYVDGEARLWAHNSPFTDVCRKTPDIRPSLITLVGRKAKALFLSHILGRPHDTKLTDYHNQIRLLCDPKSSRDDNPLLYVDCEIQNQRPSSYFSQPAKNLGKSRPIEWMHAEDEAAQHFADILSTNVLNPLSNVVCYFASDLSGVQGVARILANQVIRPKAHNLPSSALPHVLVVVETSAKVFDHVGVEHKLRADIKSYANASNVDDDLRMNFHSIQVIGMQKNWNDHVRSLALRKRLVSLAREVHWGRRTSRHLFSVSHMDALADRMLDRFCNDKSSFNFLRASRPEKFTYRDLQAHLDEVLSLMPSQSWLWCFIVPLIASALFLASYPPGSHSEAIKKYTAESDVQQKFIAGIREDMEAILSRFESDPIPQGAVRLHGEQLTSLWPHFPMLKSFKSCFSCLMLTPEKAFNCGHAICNPCIRRFGQRSRSEKHTFILSACILCGRNQSECTFRLIPPTAGIRILCLDGGGIRGVMPLTFLQHMERELYQLGCPLRDFFDYVCGTSAGGLIAIGLFLMEWSPHECMDRFEDLAAKTFMAEQKEQLSVTQRVLRLLGAYVRDYRYESSSIEKAFDSTLRISPKMFNPLQNDTKVAVTTTTVRDNIPCVLSNYNGGLRSEENIYHHVRANTQDDDISIRDAAVCTSAAPFFFKPKHVDNLDTYQDGGLQHNNPAFIASWECAFLWPDRCQILERNNGHIDHMISLGTGTSSSWKYKVGPHSPVRDRSLKRLFGNYMGHLDGEKQWQTFINCVPPNLRDRYHRFNIFFPGPEPALDEVPAIERLKDLANRFIVSNPRATLAKDSLVSSIFYFELDDFHQLDGGGYQCFGTVSCRLPLDYSGRKYLYRSLAENSAFFLVSGRPVACVETIPKGMPAFRRRIDFIAKNMDDEVHISIRGITSHPTPISGLPRKLSYLVTAQSLQIPFGCIDHREVDRPLPSIPLKRKLHEI
ncbi:FabD/lysophospholipase-like protein [Zopfia rhizophila CBS 207.26]|uniref:FabD/lysophospholipase-like protein n=1 Tax=Zopfia rhizophila CBS 207.26 TaxID=1314779 RepID=A0A6A6ERC3_9PEZI|nr:FabD/lysophospholipase-like protein [Zopfia rhizophila CBS 207.26]